VKLRLVPRSSSSLASLVNTGLSRLELRNPRLLGFLAVTLFLTDIGYEGQRSFGVFPLLFLFSPISIVAFLVVFLGLFLVVNKMQSNGAKAFAIVVITSIAAAAKSLVLMLLLHQENFAVNLQQRIAGDLTIAILYILIAAAIFNAYNNHLQVVAELNRVTARLLEQKNTTIAVADEVEAELQKRANSSLGSELDKIASSNEKVMDAGESAALKIQIQALVRNQVRPLSRELQARVQILRSIVPPELEPSKSRNLWKLKVVPNLDSSFVASYVIAMPNIFFTILSKADFWSSLIVLWISISYPILGRLIQFALPGKRISVSNALNIPAVASLAAYLPTGIAIYILGLQYPLVGLTTFTAGGVLMFAAICSTAWFALQRTRDENAAEIQKVNSEIKHELDLLDQAVWVAQRKWSYIIHGTVQGALTVASSRLEMSAKPDEKLKLAVRADIERAKTVLSSPPNFDRPLKELLGEIVDTWQGVCDVEYQIAPSAQQALEKSKTSTTCLIEILKELVSNASRHGGASKFWLNAYLNSEGDLSIVAGNNGKVMSGELSTGLGFEMITKLTKNWSLTGTTSGSFSAILPMPRN
jgi:signal transduction histidine kinase